ncbi:30S ribosomal protein S6 [Candidatus Peregrinibacteria bacterium]|nr:30S ribosomal protein S6 [Candidatus Peregrinibacteria bacterium]
MNYELMLIFSPELGEAGTDTELKEVSELISSNGGEIKHQEVWGLRDLAYRIKKQEQGIYAVLNFDYPTPEKVNELNKNLVLMNNVLRFLVTKTPADFQILTLKDIEAEEQKLEAEKGKDSRKKEKKVAKPAAPPAPVKKEEKVEEPKEEVKEEGEEENVEEEKKEEKKVKEKESKNRLSDVDEKLKSLINDPDISL